MYDLLLQECFWYTLCGSKDFLSYGVSTDVLHPRCHIQGKFGSLLCAVVYLLRVHILCSSQQHLLSFRDHHREEVGDALVALANYPRFSIRNLGRWSTCVDLIHLPVGVHWHYFEKHPISPVVTRFFQLCSVTWNIGSIFGFLRM